MSPDQTQAITRIITGLICAQAVTLKALTAHDPAARDAAVNGLQAFLQEQDASDPIAIAARRLLEQLGVPPADPSPEPDWLA